MLFVLVSIMAAGPLLNYGVSASSALVVERLGIDDGLLGTIVSVVFVSAAVTSLWLGRLADRLSVRAQVAIVYGGSALALVVAAFAQQYALLLVAAALVGPTQAIANPTTNRIILAEAPPGRKTSWIGVKQSGVQASQLFAGLFFPAVALAFGWTGAALGAACVALLLWVIAEVVLGRAADAAPSEGVASGRKVRGRRRQGRPDAAEKARAQDAVKATTSAAGRGTTRAAERLPAEVWLTAAIAFLNGLGTQSTNVYLALFAVREVGFGVTAAGMAVAVAGVVGVVSRVMWGRRMDAGGRPTTLLMIIGLGAIGSTVLLVLAGTLHQPALVWAAAAMHGISALGTNVVLNAFLLTLVPRERIGAASGVNSMGMFAGFSLGPIVMGAVLGATGHFTVGWWVMGGLYACGILVVLVLRACVGGRPETRGPVWQA
ncbi:arabinose ABC transporter permease [Micrococcus sp. HMSC067E09]|nr:arabinose ABC transporter permease [Micrococcus sp. HMSC067E09]